MKFKILLIFFATNLLNAQTAFEEVFDNYWQIGLSNNYSLYFTYNEDNRINYKIENTKMYDIGIVYNIYQWNKNNIQIGVNYQPLIFTEKLSYSWLEEDTGIAALLALEESEANYGIIKFNILFQRELIEDIYFGLGPELSILTMNHMENGHFFISDGDETTGMSYIKPEQDKLQFGINAQVGIMIPTKNIGLFDFNIKGHYHASKMTETYVTSQFINEPRFVTSKHGYNGHYVGIGLNYYPKRKQSK